MSQTKPRVGTSSLFALLIITALSITTVSGVAWDFNMKVKYVNRVRFIERTGEVDLFGIDNAQTGIGLAGPRIYNRGALGAYVGSSPSDLACPAETQRTKQLMVGGALTPVPRFRVRDLTGNPTAMRITRGGFSRHQGGTFLANEQKFTFFPEFKLNDNIKVGTAVNLGSQRNKFFAGGSTANDGAGEPPFGDFMMLGDAQSGEDTAAMASWTGVAGAIEMPWGAFYLKPKVPFGTGCTFGPEMAFGDYVLAVPYGPFTFAYSLWVTSGDGQDGSQNSGDSGTQNKYFHGLFTSYENGPWNMGAGVLLRKKQTDASEIEGDTPFSTGAGNEGAVDRNVRPEGNRDELTKAFILFAKFNNGRFFFNGEYAWMTVDRAPMANIPPATLQGRFTSQFGAQWGGDPLFNDISGEDPNLYFRITKIYMEAYHAFLEAGVILGPARLSLMWAQASGPVLNNRNVMTRAFTGRLDQLSWRGGQRFDNNPKVYAAWPIDKAALVPYQYLMFGQYAGGNMGGSRVTDLGFSKSVEGAMTDAFAFGGRLDYSVAANLNVWGSFMWAHRLEQAGTFFGQYAIDGTDAVGTNNDLSTSNGNRRAGDPNPLVDGSSLTRAAWGQIAGRSGFDPDGLGAANAIYGYCSDGLVGWEFNVGCDWLLLDGLLFSLRYSYWQPGPWFKEAYQAVVGVHPAGDRYLQGVAGERSAVQALQWSFSADL